MTSDTKSELKDVIKTTGAAIAIGAAIVGTITYVSLPAPPVQPWVEYSWTNGIWPMPYGWPDKYPQATMLEQTTDLKTWTVLTNISLTNHVRQKWTIRLPRTNSLQLIRARDYYD